MALDERHYKSGACVLRECGFVYDASDVCAGVHACEGDVPCVLPQHSAALPIVML